MDFIAAITIIKFPKAVDLEFVMIAATKFRLDQHIGAFRPDQGSNKRLLNINKTSTKIQAVYTLYNIQNII